MANIERTYHDVSKLDKATALAKVKDVMDISSSTEFFTVVKDPDSIKPTCSKLVYIEGKPNFKDYIKPHQHYCFKGPTVNQDNLVGSDNKLGMRVKINRMEFIEPIDDQINIRDEQRDAKWTSDINRIMHHCKSMWLQKSGSVYYLYFLPYFRTSGGSSDSVTDVRPYTAAFNTLESQWHLKVPISNVRLIEFDAFEVHPDSVIDSTDKNRIFNLINRLPSVDDYADVVLLTQSPYNRFSISIRNLSEDNVVELRKALEYFDLYDGYVANDKFLNNFVKTYWSNKYNANQNEFTDRYAKELDPGPLRFGGRQFFVDDNNKYWRERLKSGETVMLYSDLNHHAATFIKIVLSFTSIVAAENIKIHTHSTKQLFRDISLRGITHSRYDELIIGNGNNWNDSSYTSKGIRFVEDINLDKHGITNCSSITTANIVSSGSASLTTVTVNNSLSVKNSARFYSDVTIDGALIVQNDFKISDMFEKSGNTLLDNSTTTYTLRAVIRPNVKFRPGAVDVEFGYNFISPTAGSLDPSKYTFVSASMHMVGGFEGYVDYFVATIPNLDVTKTIYFTICIDGDKFIRKKKPTPPLLTNVDFSFTPRGLTVESIAVSFYYSESPGIYTGACGDNNLNGSPFVVIDSDGHFYKTDITFDTTINSSAVLDYRNPDYSAHKVLAIDGQWQTLSPEYVGASTKLHTHGNITTDGKIESDTTAANNFKLVMTNASDELIRTNLALNKNDGIATRKNYLSQYGEFNTLRDLFFHAAHNTTDASNHFYADGTIMDLDEATEIGIYRFKKAEQNGTRNVPGSSTNDKTSDSSTSDNRYKSAAFTDNTYGICLVLTSNGFSADTYDANNNSDTLQHLVQIAFSGEPYSDPNGPYTNMYIRNKKYVKSGSGNDGNWSEWIAFSQFGHRHDLAYAALNTPKVRSSIALHSSINGIESATGDSATFYKINYNPSTNSGDVVTHTLYSSNKDDTEPSRIRFVISTYPNINDDTDILTLFRKKNGDKSARFQSTLELTGALSFSSTGSSLISVESGTDNQYVVLADFGGEASTTATIKRSSITAANLYALSGVTSDVQTQLDNRLPLFKISSTDSALNANSVSTHDAMYISCKGITGAAHTNHSVLLDINSVGTPFQLQIPDSTEDYVYKRSYSSSAWSSWRKLKAGYADSAGAVAWTNVSGKTTATATADGLMSATDKANFDTLWAAWGATDDADTVVNTLREIKNIFADYSESTTIVNMFASKANTADVSSAGNAAISKIVSRNAAGSIQSEKFAVSSGTTTKATMQYNTSEDCIEFIFA